MKTAFCALVLLASGAAAAAQDDFELAGALAERGWYDLAEDLFNKIASNASLAPEQNAEGRFGIARMKISMAERAESIEEKNRLYEKAIEEMNAFLKKYPEHRRRGEALSDIGYLYQSKGKALVAAARADPTKMDAAEKAFSDAEKLFLDLIEQLKKEEKKPPEDAKNKAAQLEYDKWEERMMYAKYNYAVSLFSHAETFRDTPHKHGDMKRLLEQMNTYIQKDFMWQYEAYLLAYDVFIYMGRAFELLAESSDRERAEEYWKQCFTYIGKAKGLLTDNEYRKNEAVRDICARACLYEMKARIAYGDARRGQLAAKQYAEAPRHAEDLFRVLPNVRLEEMGKALRIEQARAYCKAGPPLLEKGIKLLQEMARQYKDTWVENVAVDTIGLFAVEQDVALAIDAADNLFERGPVFLYKAMQRYRKAMQAIKKPADQKRIPYCWHQIGRCYYYLDRYFEAVVALSELEKPEYRASEESSKAAMLKLQSLQRIAKMTKDKADEKAMEDFRLVVTRLYPKEAGRQLKRLVAIELENKQKFSEAAKLWEQLAAPGKDTYEEAIFSVGLNLYREGDRFADLAVKEKVAVEKEKLIAKALANWKRALEAFKKHLQHVDKMPAKDAKIVKNAIGSILFSCKILVHPRFDRADEALAISNDLDKRFPNADPKFSIIIMALRLDAKVKKGRIEEAEDDLKSLKAKYEKERLGHDHYSRALAVLAGAFEDAAAKETDEEKRDVFGTRAANYYYEYYLLNPGQVSKPDQMLAMAEKLYGAAEVRMKLGPEKLGEEGLAEARRIYSKSRELFNEYTIQKADIPPDDLRSIKKRITRCLLMTGKFEEAIRNYEWVTKDDPKMNDGNAWEELADCYVEKASSQPRGSARNAVLKQADDIYGKLGGRLLQLQLVNEHAWRLLYKHAQILFETEPDVLRRFFDQYRLRGFAPKWDDDKWGYKTRMKALEDKLDAVVPPKKS